MPFGLTKGEMLSLGLGYLQNQAWHARDRGVGLVDGVILQHKEAIRDLDIDAGITHAISRIQDFNTPEANVLKYSIAAYLGLEVAKTFGLKLPLDGGKLLNWGLHFYGGSILSEAVSWSGPHENTNNYSSGNNSVTKPIYQYYK